MQEELFICSTGMYGHIIFSACVCTAAKPLHIPVFFLVSLQCSKKAQYSLQRGKPIVLGDVRPCTFGWFVNSLTEPKTVCGSPSLSFTD